MSKSRIISLASLVDKDSSVLDIGTDHAYLPIYLIKNNICNSVTASDISKNVLEYSKKNIIKYNMEDKIKLVLSDGFSNITDEFDIAVIAGMGFNTIKKILDTDKLPNKLIIQCNNDLDLLRSFMNKINYKILNEVVVKDKGIYYVIIKYGKGKEILDTNELEFGISKNLDYYNYLLLKYSKVNTDIFKEKKERLKEFIERIQD
ncbi:MAG: class I SAM-dependent methyltransferase [Bacilli bacterium]